MTEELLERLRRALSDEYELLSEIGRGGMASVYRARDLRHQRTVAVKVLRPEFTSEVGPDRFEAEIRTTATLQHPHILPLFDSGEFDGHLYYVMPYVEGESLRERLDRERQLSIDDALELTAKVAGALQEAHDAGVIHRDIKPANILLAGHEPLVADFGIALALRGGGASRLTEAGRSVGTPHYMSPEQAAGDDHIGPASDIFALGCVLYEMLVGHPPFVAGTPHGVLGKILTGTAPRASSERRSVPPNVDAALSKALETVPADRFRRAADFAAALRNSDFRRPRSEASRSGGTALPWKVATAVLGLGALVAGWIALSGPDEGSHAAAVPLFRVPLEFDAEQALSGTGHFDLSSDGSVLVYQGVGEGATTRLWVRRGEGDSSTPIQGADGVNPGTVPDIAVSPEGRRVGFWKGRDYLVVPVAGGIPRVVADSVWGVTRWSRDGEWLYLRRFGHPGISRVPADGGAPEVVTRPDTAAGVTGHVWPDPLPGGEALVVEGRTDDGSRILAVDLTTGETRDLGPGRYPRYASGWLLHGDEERGRLLAAPFDPVSLEVTGARRTLLDEVAAWGPPLAGAMGFAVSETGILAYAPAREAVATWITPEGATRVVDREWRFEPGAPPTVARLSPDDARVVVAAGPRGELDLWVKELDAGPLVRITSRTGSEVPVGWRDPETVVFRAEGPKGGTADLWTVPADGSSAPVPWHRDSVDIADAVLPGAGGPGLLLSANRWTGSRYEGRDLYTFVPGDPGATRLALRTDGFSVSAPTLSPDGDWLAYVTRGEVVVRSFPDLERRRVQVSLQGGGSPMWSPEGRTLHYLNGDGELVRARLGPDGQVIDRTALFALEQGIGQTGLHLADSGRFFSFRSRPKVVFIFNWTELAGSLDSGA